MCPKSLNLELMTFDTNNLKIYCDLIPVNAGNSLARFPEFQAWGC